MATIKSYTDFSQSKTLSKILPIESADMGYLWNGHSFSEYPVSKQTIFNRIENISCWTLSALLNVLPKGEHKDIDLCCGGYKGDEYIPKWFCSYEQQEPIIIEICHADNPIDACYEMIVKLHEQKLL